MSNLKGLVYVLVGLVLLLTFTITSYAGDKSATLTWDANTEEDLVGYRIFYRIAGQGYNYEAPAWEGSEVICTISGLDYDVIYYFVARAFDESGNESGDSNEVSVYFGQEEVPDKEPPKEPCLLRWLKKAI